jgi:hypothetical protein
VISTSPVIDDGTPPRIMKSDVITAVFVGDAGVKFGTRCTSPCRGTLARSASASASQRAVFVIRTTSTNSAVEEKEKS